MKNEKLVTLCGSMRFWKEIEEAAERLELEKGYAVICPLRHVRKNVLSDRDKERLSELHRMKIDRSDAIFVVNVGGYVGESVRREIEYAVALGKQVMYLMDDL